MIKWIFEHLGIVIVAIVFLTQIIRALLQAKKSEPRDVAKPSTLEEERRVREVQEQIRRQIAARRGAAEAAEPPVVMAPSESRPEPRPQTTQMPEPFGGPLGRMLEELQRRAQQQHAPAPRHVPPMLERRNVAELERQQKIADELAAAEEARRMAEHRAAHLAADKRAEAESEPVLRTAARDHLLHDLQDVQSLRRAFVLREVLGTPVGLR
jgi:hypothetical protein